MEDVALGEYSESFEFTVSSVEVEVLGDALKRAAKVGDGWYPEQFPRVDSISMLTNLINKLDEYCKENGMCNELIKNLKSWPPATLYDALYVKIIPSLFPELPRFC